LNQDESDQGEKRERAKKKTRERGKEGGLMQNGQKPIKERHVVSSRTELW